jgi:two-component system sensor histidine kinase/response regulator
MIDIKTIILLSVISSFLMGLGLFSIANKKENKNIVRWWAFGNILQSFGWIILGVLRGVIPDVLSIVIGQIFMLSSLFIWNYCISRILKFNVSFLFFFFILFLEMIALYYYTIYEPNITNRIITISILSGLVMSQVGYKFFKYRKINSNVFKFNASLYSVCAFVFFFRAFYHYHFNPLLVAPFANFLWVENMSYLVFFLTSIISPFGFIMITHDIHFHSIESFEDKIRLLTASIEQSPISIIITDSQGNIQYVNPKFSEVTGYTFEEVNNKNPRILKSGFTSSEQYEKMWNSILSGEVWRGKFKNKKKNGEIYWESVTIAPIHDTNGKIVSFIGLKENITNQILAERELKNSQFNIENIVNSTNDIVYTMDIQGRHTEIFGDWINRYGLKSEDFLGKTAQEILSGDTSKHDLAFLKAIKGERVSYEWESKNKEFTQYFLTSLSPLIVDGHIEGVLGVGRDVTEIKLSQILSNENEFKIKAIFDTIEIGITITDPEGNIIDCNNASEKLLGISKEEHLIRNYAGVEWKIIRPDLSPMSPDEYASVIALRENRPVFNVQMGILKKDESITWLNVNASPINLPNYGVVISYIDITSIKNSETILKKAKDEAERANRIKSEFLANMSHDIRTPMNAVIGFTEIIKEKVGDDPDLLGDLNAIQKSGKTLINLLNDILDLARIESGLLELTLLPVNLIDTIADLEQIFSLSARKKRLILTSEIQPNLPSIFLIDELRIRQILLNLIGNAVKFTQEGSVKILLKGELSALSKDKFDLVFEIQDTGIGIPSTELSSIFEPFIQKKGQDNLRYGGSGLGLAITNKLVNLMDGIIEVESIEGKGSIFRIKLNQISQVTNPQQKTDFFSWKKIDYNECKILLVEDVKENQDVVIGLLRKTKIKIIPVENGKLALDMLAQDSFDLILMDIQMPVMDGEEATRIIKSSNLWNKIPLIILSADGMVENIEKFKNISEDYLIKPLEKNLLYKTLSKYLPHKIIS